MPVIEKKANHQFSFRSKHAVGQIHKITNKITLAFEARKYCCAMFLDILQVFDKVWYSLLFKIQQHLTIKFHAVLKSYLRDIFASNHMMS
jgi:hypothetical protein